MSTLFDMKTIQKPRRKPRVMTHCVDSCCDDTLLFECGRCGWDFEGEYFSGRSVTEDRRGRPCPICNADESIAAAMKPLFVPLNAEYYDAFASGDKDTEYRMFGRGWNFKTCIVGRPVLLSRGYGKQSRMAGTVVRFQKLWWKNIEDAAAVAAIEKLFGKRAAWMACVKIKVIQ